MTRLLVTGGSGFVGRGLIPALLEAGHAVRALTSPRAGARPPELGCRWHQADLGEPASLPAAALEGVEVVIHLAGLAHRPRGGAEAAESRLERVNVAGSEALARRAAAAGVRRLLFVSSVLVHGQSAPGGPLTEASPIAPGEAYGRSKARAEAALAGVAAETGLELAVVRSPLVYGPGVKGNFARLMAWALAGRPVPSGFDANRRSLVARANLCDLLIAAALDPAAAGQAFLVSDREDLSTGELYRRLARAGGARPWTLPLPRAPLAAGLRLIGRGGLAASLLGDLTVDPAKAERLLGWRPRVSLQAGLAETVAWHQRHGDECTN